MTNYELSSKTISTVSGGYGIDNLSVAVLVNRASLLASLGGNPAPEAVERRMSELQQLVASAAGTRSERGDIIKVVAVDFIDSGHDLEPQPPHCWRFAAASNRDRCECRNDPRRYIAFNLVWVAPGDESDFIHAGQGG